MSGTLGKALGVPEESKEVPKVGAGVEAGAEEFAEILAPKPAPNPDDLTSDFEIGVKRELEEGLRAADALGAQGRAIFCPGSLSCDLNPCQ